MTPALVIGGGLSGAALAMRLTLAGRAAVLVEREAEPREKVCGEFLSAEAAGYLTSLGVDLTGLGAVPIDAVRLCAGTEVTTVPLPFAAVSLSRRVLDEALLTRAAAEGVTIRRGAKVQSLSPATVGWSAVLEGGDRIDAGSVFLATGKHDLRGHPRPPGSQNDLVAFKLHWRLSPDQTAALKGHVELVLFEGGYAGLQPVEGGRANLCLVLRRRRLLALGQRWDAVLTAITSESAHLAMRLTGATACSERPLALAAIPYGHIASQRDGLWRLGDQAVVIPSFSGDGMSIALHTAELAAASYLAGKSAETYRRRLHRDVAWQVRVATALSHLLVRTGGQTALARAARRWPQLVSNVAFHTRVSDQALARTLRAPGAA